jgi:serine/threonine-protein kinase
MGVLSLHLTEPPPVIPPEIFDTIGAPRELAAVIDRALAKDRNQRFSTIDELARAVRRASGDKPTGPVVAQSSVAAPPSATMGRVKTQWTGNLSVPEIEARPPAQKSRLPLILGAIALVGGAAGVAAYLTTRGGGSPAGAATGSSVPAPPTPTAPTPPTNRTAPVVVPATPPPLAFEWSQIRIDSSPTGADVKDLTNGKVIGHTPFSFKLRPSHTPRQFELHRKGYIDAVVEVVPDREKLDSTEKLERGTGRKPPPPPPPPQKDQAQVPSAPPTPTDKPAAPVEPTKPPVPPKADDDCGDPPCLKADPSRAGSGSAQ